jgi:hypothetical protein
MARKRNLEAIPTSGRTSRSSAVGQSKPKTKAPPKPKPTPAELLAAAHAALEQEGVVKQSALGPAASRAELITQLVRAGYEATKNAIRKPIGAQLGAALASGRFISLKSVGAHVVGASAKEVKAVAAELVKSGSARLVQRGTAQVLVPPSTPVIERAALVQFGKFAKEVAKVASSKSNVALLQADFLEEVERVVASVRSATPGRAPRQREPRQEEPEPKLAAPSAAREGASRQAHLAQLLAAVEERRDPTTGLSFVPDIVATLRGRLTPESTREALVAAARDGVLELRPEGGIGRLSEEQLALCPPGPQGTRLSWARRTEEAVG